MSELNITSEIEFAEVIGSARVQIVLMDGFTKLDGYFGSEARFIVDAINEKLARKQNAVVANLNLDHGLKKATNTPPMPEVKESEPTKTLRDEFAMAAMQLWLRTGDTDDEAAERAYEYADAMLEARK